MDLARLTRVPRDRARKAVQSLLLRIAAVGSGATAAVGGGAAAAVGSGAAVSRDLPVAYSCSRDSQ